MENKKIIFYGNLLKNLAIHLEIDLFAGKHYEPESERIYFYFNNGENININEINKRSNEIGKINNMVNRPILVFHYNPQRNIIFVPDENY